MDIVSKWLEEDQYSRISSVIRAHQSFNACNKIIIPLVGKVPYWLSTKTQTKMQLECAKTYGDLSNHQEKHK